jgi:hypothetical protein
MIRHMRNTRNISISIRSIVSNHYVLLILLVGSGFGELDKFLTIYFHPCVVFITSLLMCPPCIQVHTPCIFNLFIHRVPLLLLVMNWLVLLLRSNLGCVCSLLKLLHYISMVILRRLHFSLLLQLVLFNLMTFDFNLQVIILLPYSFITRFYKYLLNLGRLTLITKSTNINIIVPFTTFACRDFWSFGIS